MDKKNQDRATILTMAFERLSMATTLSMITQTVAEAARALTGADGSTFVLREEDACYYADEDAISPLWKDHKFPMEACISGWSMLHGKVVTIKDIYQDTRIPHDAYRPTFVKSLCMTPIRPENAVGAIGTYWATEHTPSLEDIQVLQVLANSTAVAIENLELKKKIGNQKARNRDLEVEMFSLGHDLRTPISAMVSLADLLKMHLAPYLSKTTSDFFEMLIQTGSQATEQIERMLSLYRATNGKIEKQHIDLTSVAKEALNKIQLQYPERRILATIQEDLMTYGDQRLICMVLENLLSNAVKYSSKKSESQIEVGCLYGGKGKDMFFVRDNGDGFDQTQAHRLFKPMGRLHENNEFEGTGLGLVSVAKIVALHGGQLRAEGKKAVGATFFFSLPPNVDM